MKSTGFILILSSLLLIGCGNQGDGEAETNEINAAQEAIEEAKVELEVARKELGKADTEKSKLAAEKKVVEAEKNLEEAEQRLKKAQDALGKAAAASLTEAQLLQDAIDNICKAKVLVNEPTLLIRCRKSGASLEKMQLCLSQTRHKFMDTEKGNSFVNCLEASTDQTEACRQVVGGRYDTKECIEIVKDSEITGEEIKACEEASYWRDSPRLDCIKKESGKTSVY